MNLIQLGSKLYLVKYFTLMELIILMTETRLLRLVGSILMSSMKWKD
mgnify:CR=1 FL=1